MRAAFGILFLFLSTSGLPAEAELSKEVINQTISKSRSSVRSCLNQALKVMPDLKGKVVTRFSIEPSGKVVSASIKQTTVENAALEKCILAVIEKIQFPKSPVVTEVVAYPFFLSNAK